jgi:hypothetical protein
MPANDFASVKLPVSLVSQAREAAQPMRRSVASQIEYWATLGKALEHAGLTTIDSHALIAREERASYSGATGTPSSELADLHTHVLALAKSGTLNARAHVAVEENKAKASARTRSRKAA